MNIFFVKKDDVLMSECDSLMQSKVNAAAIIEESNMKVLDCIKEVETGIFKWNRTIFLSEEDRKDFTNLKLSITLCKKEDFFMIPCVSYHGNHWGDGKEPKGLEADGKPWKFASHRSGIPGGMYAQSEEISLGMWGDIDNPSGFSCFMERTGNGGLTMNIQFPEQEGPYLYSARDHYERESVNEAVCWKKDIIELKAFIVIKKRTSRYDYAFFLDSAWKFFRENSTPIRCKKELWRLAFSFILESAFFRESGFSGFCMGLTWEKEQWVPKRDYLEIGWVGQNASLAVSLLYKYALEKDEAAGKLGLEILDCWAENAVLSNGLFRCRFDKILHPIKEGEEERNDAANLYSVVEEYLEAYKLLKELGMNKEEYKAIALGVCNFMITIQKEDGSLGKAWFNDGRCSDTDGTVGSYMSKALCLAFLETKERVYLEAACKSYHYYLENFLSYGYTTAGALDTYCVDKESAIPLLGTALMLYEFTQKANYLEEALIISYYLSTWQYHFNVSYYGNTILGQMEYQTRGGTAVSVQHHHIDCYGLAFYEDFIILSKLTGNPIWKERAEAIWNNSLFNISDGNLIVNGKRRPKGSQDEGFLQTRWHTKKGEYFGVSEWLVVWNTAFRLKIIRKEYLARKREYDKNCNPI